MPIDIEEVVEALLRPRIAGAVAVAEGEDAVPILQRGEGAEQREGLGGIGVRRGVVVFGAEERLARHALRGEAGERAAVGRAGHGLVLHVPHVGVPALAVEVGVLPVGVRINHVHAHLHVAGAPESLRADDGRLHAEILFQKVAHAVPVGGLGVPDEFLPVALLGGGGAGEVTLADDGDAGFFIAGERAIHARRTQRDAGELLEAAKLKHTRSLTHAADGEAGLVVGFGDLDGRGSFVKGDAGFYVRGAEDFPRLV